MATIYLVDSAQFTIGDDHWNTTSICLSSRFFVSSLQRGNWKPYFFCFMFYPFAGTCIVKHHLFGRFISWEKWLVAKQWQCYEYRHWNQGIRGCQEGALSLLGLWGSCPGRFMDPKPQWVRRLEEKCLCLGLNCSLFRVKVCFEVVSSPNRNHSRGQK